MKLYQNEELRCFQVLLYGILEQRGATKSNISRVERGQIVPTATSFFRIPEQKLPFTYSTYGNVSIRDVGFWQGDDAYVTENGYESGIYADGSCFICAQYYVSAGSLGLAMYDYFVAD